MEKQENNLQTTVTFQLILMAISSVILTALFTYTFYKFDTFEKLPYLETNYPQSSQVKPNTIKTGLYIRDFSTFDIREGEFVFDGTIWFQFDPKEISLDNIKKFTFAKGKLEFISEPRLRKEGVFDYVYFDIRLSFKNDLDNRHYPISDHAVYIILENRFFSANQVKFESNRSSLVFPKNFKVIGWNLHDYKVYSGFVNEQVDLTNPKNKVSYPSVIFAIDLDNIDIEHLITLIFPLLLIFFLNVFTFSMNPFTYMQSIISISIGSIAAMIAYKFVIEKDAPNNDYFMVSDYLFYIFIAMVFIIFLFNIDATKLSGRKKEIVSIVLHGIVVATVSYLLLLY